MLVRGTIAVGGGVVIIFKVLLSLAVVHSLGPVDRFAVPVATGVDILSLLAMTLIPRNIGEFAFRIRLKWLAFSLRNTVDAYKILSSASHTRLRISRHVGEFLTADFCGSAIVTGCL